jgi:hypothetical protein
MPCLRTRSWLSRQRKQETKRNGGKRSIAKKFPLTILFRYKNNQIDKAVELYSEALKHDPTNVVLYTNKAAALMEKKGTFLFVSRIFCSDFSSFC